MPQIRFLPEAQTYDVAEGTKILVAAIKNKVPLRFGCAACQCGTCAVAVTVHGDLYPMAADEQALLARMHLSTDGSVRLACRAKIKSGLVIVDLSFQERYSPDAGLLS